MKRIIIVLIFCVWSINLIGQNYASTIGVNGGYTQEGFGVLADYNYFLDRFNAVHGGVFVSFSNDEFEGNEIPYTLFSFQAGYTRIVWNSYNRKFNISLTGGGLVGYEVINNGNQELSTGALIQDKSKFIYGIYLGGELDYVIAPDWSIIFRAQESYHINSDLGNLTPYIGIGVRYFLF